MEINKEKKQKELERYFLAPSLRPFLGVTIKEDTDIEDEFELASEDGLQRKKVQQTIKGRVFTTETVYEQDLDEETSMREEGKIVYVLPLGTRLIWEPNVGYIVPKEAFHTLEEIKENYKIVEE
jgi:hypothetical protein